MYLTKFGENSFKILLILYFIGYSLSIALLYMFDIRPTVYYVVIALLATTILMEILTSSIHTSNVKIVIILSQIMFLSLNVIWGVTLKYYYYTGYTDIFGAAGLAENLLKTGFVTDIFDIYKPFPLWHILADGFYLLSGLSLPMNKILNILGGIAFFFMPPIVYILSNKSLGKRVSLLAALIAFFYPTVIVYGMYSIPRSVESLFTVFLLILLFDQPNKVKYYLAVFLMFIIIVYHTASVPFILAILLIIYILQILFSKNDKNSMVTLKFLITSGVMTLVYWELFAKMVIDSLLSDILSSAPSGDLTKAVYSTPLSEMFNYLQYSPTLLFLIIGVLLVLKYKVFNDRLKLMGVAALLMVPLTFPGPLLLINKLAGNLNLGRFEEYAFILFVLMAAVGFFYLYHRSPKLFKVGLIALFTIWVFLSISNEFVASDNPLVKRPFYTFYLTEEEITATDQLHNVTTGNVLSDYVPVRYLNSTEFVGSTSMISIDQNDTKLFTKDNDTVLIRDGELSKRPLQLITIDSEGNPDLGDYYYRDDKAFNLLDNYSRIYNSNTVSAYSE